MFDRLLDIFLSFGNKISFFQVVNQYEVGVKLRLGKLVSIAHPGLNFKYPFLDCILTTNGVSTTVQLQAQTLTTSDDICLMVGTVVRYSISQPELFLLEIWDGAGVLSDTVMGIVKQVISDHPFKDLNSEDICQVILRKSRTKLSKYGLKIEAVTFSDFGKIKTIRLISNDALNSDEHG